MYCCKSVPVLEVLQFLIKTVKRYTYLQSEFLFLQMLFLSFDTDRSGKMSSYELRIALKAAGESRLLTKFTYYIIIEIFIL